MDWPDDFINKVICGDCLKILPLIPDGAVDAVITDPPYGLAMDVAAHKNSGQQHGNAKCAKGKYIDTNWDSKPFEPTALLNRYFNIPMFIFGANHFSRLLPEMTSWLVWDKRCDLPSNDYGDAELIWSNIGGPVRIIRHRWNGMIKDSERGQRRSHPTQKPIAVMSQIISKWTRPDDLILDPYAGSGSTLVAAKRLGRRYVGIEISPEYCKIAEDRLRQGELFNASP